MKLLIIGHHIVVKGYQELWTAAADLYSPDLEFEILCPEVYGQNGLVRAEPLDAEKVPIHTLKTFFGRAGRQHLHFYSGLGRALDRIRPDYVYCAEESNSLVAAQVGRACVKRGIPYLLWTSLNHPRIYREMYGRLNIRRHLFHHCQQYSFAHCAGVNATSEDAFNTLRAQGFAGKIVCRPTHGVGSDFLEAGRRRLADNPSPSRMKIGFIGQFHNCKAVDVLIKAFARLPFRDTVQLVVRGDGEMGSHWRSLAVSQGLGSTIRWQPRVPYEQMPEVMSQLDVLVLPSMHRDGVDEKFGRVLIEAMAAGTVAVGSRSAGIPKAMAGAGILFTPGDDVQLADILQRLYSDHRYWREHQQRGYQTVQNTYSCRARAGDLIEGIREEIGWFHPLSSTPATTDLQVTAAR